MDVKHYWKILIRRWWLAAVPVLVVLAYTAITYSSPPTVYQVVMRYAAGTEPAGLSEDYDRYYPWLTSEYIANGLADVAETRAFAEGVSARLQGIDPAAIQGAIVTDNAQSILVVYVTWADADQVGDVADAVTAELVENGAAYYPQLEGLDPAVRLLDAPNPVPLPPGLRAQLMGPMVRAGLAFAVGIALAFLWHYLDPTVREAQELEAAGIDVLAEIPK
jgi:capsular polysaccharide biosynthesis protein